ncbi:helix-turn-helix domain-containing protein [Rhodococcus opacus]|uniref:helix-turn-helix domain-containing protein n=1 Tax=Rhodococcus TaxID=1827 RepID=UPI00030CB2AC|nr:MerR family transcriptional regulator [Rhodococcus opacus]MDJ0420769.1 hypothetical protein [Rhodococcus opacus]MDV6248065.1 hypothetical protein [Rhodococcus opacus]MDV7090933.1 hypothetical protein [Rhodococcus opacus]UNN04498.1 hypothetical protein MOO23_36190 [Rhodococcus opacus]
MVVHEENGFLEYLDLQGDLPDQVTKSELLAQVREAGFSLSDRQLTFYVTEGLVPRSVRVGTRAGTYPVSVVWLMKWILQARDAGVSIEALKELLPVWKFLIRAQRDELLDIGGLESVARQHVTSYEASLGVPRVVSYVLMRACCPTCRGKIRVVYKDGTERSLNDADATIGFAIARTPTDDADDAAAGTPQWWASARIALSIPSNHSTDPTTVILGVKPNEALPPDPSDHPGHNQASTEEEEHM